MTAFLGLLTSRLGAIGAWVAVAALTVLLIVAKVEARSARHDLKQAALHRDTWKAASQQWERNYDVVHNALLLQNAAVTQLGSDRRAWQADARAQVLAANRETEKAKARYVEFLRRPIKASGSCPRVEEVAAAIREDMR